MRSKSSRCENRFSGRRRHLECCGRGLRDIAPSSGHKAGVRATTVRAAGAQAKATHTRVSSLHIASGRKRTKDLSKDHSLIKNPYGCTGIFPSRESGARVWQCSTRQGSLCGAKSCSGNSSIPFFTGAVMRRRHGHGLQVHVWNRSFKNCSKSVLCYEMAANAAIDDVEKNAWNAPNPHRLKHTSWCDEAEQTRFCRLS